MLHTMGCRGVGRKAIHVSTMFREFRAKKETEMYVELTLRWRGCLRCSSSALRKSLQTHTLYLLSGMFARLLHAHCKAFRVDAVNDSSVLAAKFHSKQCVLHSTLRRTRNNMPPYTLNSKTTGIISQSTRSSSCTPVLFLMSSSLPCSLSTVAVCILACFVPPRRNAVDDQSVSRRPLLTHGEDKFTVLQQVGANMQMRSTDSPGKRESAQVKMAESNKRTRTHTNAMNTHRPPEL